MKSGKGFTLIEILVAATIIALLSSVAAVTFSQFSQQSRDAKRKADLEQIRAAVEMYRSNNDVYPATIGTSLCDPGGCASGTYMQKVPSDPKGTTYAYYYAGSDTDYTVGAYLEATSTSCSVAISCTGANCNYCLGPYGAK
ncbi:MAG: type II secretion system protein [Patescibacteria group bacterium]